MCRGFKEVLGPPLDMVETHGHGGRTTKTWKTWGNDYCGGIEHDYAHPSKNIRSVIRQCRHALFLLKVAVRSLTLKTNILTLNFLYLRRHYGEEYHRSLMSSSCLIFNNILSCELFSSTFQQTPAWNLLRLVSVHVQTHVLYKSDLIYIYVMLAIIWIRF
jgi:hypothetical protein